MPEPPKPEPRRRPPPASDAAARTHHASRPAAAPSRVVSRQLAYGGDAPTRLDYDAPHVFVLAPITGEVLVDGTLLVTPRTPAVLAQGERACCTNRSASRPGSSARWT